MSRQELIIWAAGFIDGEGCISVAKHSPRPNLFQYYHRYGVTLQVGQQVKAPLEILKALFGGTILKREIDWCWKIGGRPMALALEELLPFLVVKTAQAKIGIVFQRRKVKKGCKYPNPKLARELDELDYQNMKILKNPETNLAEEAA